MNAKKIYQLEDAILAYRGRDLMTESELVHWPDHVYEVEDNLDKRTGISTIPLAYTEFYDEEIENFSDENHVDPNVYEHTVQVNLIIDTVNDTYTLKKIIDGKYDFYVNHLQDVDDAIDYIRAYTFDDYVYL